MDKASHLRRQAHSHEGRVETNRPRASAGRGPKPLPSRHSCWSRQPVARAEHAQAATGHLPHARQRCRPIAVQQEQQRLRELAMAAFERDLLQVRAARYATRSVTHWPPFTARQWQGTPGWSSPAAAGAIRWASARDPAAGALAARGRALAARLLAGAGPGPGQPAAVQQALDGVKRYELRFLDLEGRWLQSWPPANSRPRKG